MGKSSGVSVGQVLFSAVGIVAALTFAPVGANLLPYIAQGFAIGFSVGSFLFPPELEAEEGEDPELDLPSTTEGQPYPLVVGFGMVRNPVITYFDSEGVRSLKGEDDFEGQKLFYAPVQMAVCICEYDSQNTVYDSLGVPEAGYAEAYVTGEVGSVAYKSITEPLTVTA